LDVTGVNSSNSSSSSGGGGGGMKTVQKLRHLAEKAGWRSLNTLSLDLKKMGSKEYVEWEQSLLEKALSNIESLSSAKKAPGISSKKQKTTTTESAESSSKKSKHASVETPHELQASVLTVLGLLLESGEDPRIKAVAATSSPSSSSSSSSSSIASSADIQVLPLKLRKSLQELRDACPYRNVRGEVTNVTDFGAFISLGQGAARDGLLHKSRFPRNSSSSSSSSSSSVLGGGGCPIVKGQVLEVDVLSVDVQRGRIELGLSTKKRKAEE
jgi:hypothetical protein